eukprot:m51a1_g4365 hypothetical protein (275) ;mRNA; f:293119-294446
MLSHRLPRSIDNIRTTLAGSTIAVSAVFSNVALSVSNAAKYAEFAVNMGYIDKRVGLAGLTLSFGMRFSATLEPLVQAMAPTMPLLTAWYWARGNGTDQDWNRLWIVAQGTEDYSLAYLNTTIADLLEGRATVWYAYPRQRPFDRSVRWVSPFIDEITELPVTTIEVPAYTKAGEWLGSMYADMLMVNSRSILSDLSPSFDIECIMSMTDGDIVSASGTAFDVLFPGKCVGVICNIFALVPQSADMVAPSWDFDNYSIVKLNESKEGRRICLDD